MAAYSKYEMLLWLEQMQQEQVDDIKESNEDLLWLNKKLKLQQNGRGDGLFDSWTEKRGKIERLMEDGVHFEYFRITERWFDKLKALRILHKAQQHTESATDISAH